MSLALVRGCCGPNPNPNPILNPNPTPSATPTPNRLLRAFKELVANDYPMAEALYAGGVFAVRHPPS